ncbi:MAG: hypothetical protein WC180_05710 [Candidatus Paceibacterota bacterium]
MLRGIKLVNDIIPVLESGRVIAYENGKGDIIEKKEDIEKYIFLGINIDSVEPRTVFNGEDGEE